jgi:hypothetical protein
VAQADVPLAGSDLAHVWKRGKRGKRVVSQQRNFGCGRGRE